jgi:hypothetical protein
VANSRCGPVPSFLPAAPFDHYTVLETTADGSIHFTLYFFRPWPFFVVKELRILFAFCICFSCFQKRKSEISRRPKSDPSKKGSTSYACELLGADDLILHFSSPDISTQ